MKKITILLVIIFTFLFSNTSWGDWIFVTENVDGNKFYYDKDRVRKIGNYIYFLELGDIMKPKKGFSSSIRHIELDCSIFRYKVLKLRGYKNSMGEGDIVGDYTPKDEWRYPPPNSTFEYMYKKICEEHQLRPHPLNLNEQEIGIFQGLSMNTIFERNFEFISTTEKVS